MPQIMFESFSFIVWYFSAKIRTSKMGVSCSQSFQVPGLRFEILDFVDLRSLEHIMNIHPKADCLEKS